MLFRLTKQRYNGIQRERERERESHDTIYRGSINEGASDPEEHQPSMGRRETSFISHQSYILTGGDFDYLYYNNGHHLNFKATVTFSKFCYRWFNLFFFFFFLSYYLQRFFSHKMKILPVFNLNCIYRKIPVKRQQLAML